MQEFNVDDNTTVMVPMMTHTGPFYYFNDVVRTRDGALAVVLIVVFGLLSNKCLFLFTMKVKRCTVVKLALSKRSYMMLVLPNKGIKLKDIEGKLHTDVMANWHQALKEG